MSEPGDGGYPMDFRIARAARRTGVVLLTIALLASAATAGATVGGPSADAGARTVGGVADVADGRLHLDAGPDAVAPRGASGTTATADNETDEGADPPRDPSVGQLDHGGSVDTVEEIDTTLSLEGENEGSAIAVFPDGDYAITGRFRDLDADYVARVTPDGSVEWVEEIGLSARAITTTDGGDVIVVGNAESDGPHLYRLSGDGAVVYRGAEFSDTQYQDVFVHEGSIYVAGEFENEAVIVNHTLDDGRYKSAYFPETNGTFNDVMGVSGGLIAVGAARDTDPGEAFAVRLDYDDTARVGSVRWESRYDSANPGFEAFYSATVSGGDVVAVGFADEREHDRGWDVYTARLDGADGDAIWTDRFGSPEKDWGLDALRVGERVVALTYPGPLVDDGRTAKAYLVDPSDGDRHIITEGANEGDWFWAGVGTNGDRLVITGEERPDEGGDFGGDVETMLLRYRFTSGTADISLGSDTIAQGAQATLPLTATGENIASYSAAFEFDPDVIQVREVQAADFDAPVTNIDNTAGTVTLSQAQATGVDDPTLARVVVEATGNPGDATGIRFVESDTSLSTTSGQLSIGTYGDGGITIQDCLPGDANADASISPFDATQILRHVAGLSTVDSFDSACADYNGDGSVSPFDATQVLREVAGLSTVSTSTTTTTADRSPTWTQAQTASGTLAVDSASAEPGATTTVNLTATGDDIASFGATLEYDSDLVTVSSVEGGDLGTPVANIDNDAGTVTLSGASATGVDDPTLATLTLEVATDAEPGTSTPLDLVPEDASLSTTTETLSVSVEDGTLTVPDTEPEPTVTITDAMLEPNEVSDGQTVTHTLTFDISGVSDDGNTDTFTVEFPPEVDSISPNSVRVEDGDGDPVSITGAEASGDVYTFSISPDSSAETREVTATVDVDVSYPDVDSDTTETITASVSDSAHGSDSAEVGVTIRDDTSGDDGTCPTVGGSDAEDPDGDGLCEDVNGDDVVVPGDGTVLFNAVFEGTVASDATRLDMNGDGTVTAGDATVLFNEAFEASDAPPATDGVATTLSLAPTDQRVAPGESVTYEITASDVEDGISAYDLTVSVDDSATATITDASNAIGGNQRVEIASDGSSVQIGAFAGDTVDRGSDVVVATVTVAGESAGEASLSIEPTSVSDENGADRYRITGTEPATVTVGESTGDVPIEVAVYSEDGGDLPLSSTTGNPVLAGDITNRLRFEVFPADPADAPLEEPVTLALAGPTAEVDTFTRTVDVDEMSGTDLVTPNRTDGHVGFIQVTPTATGEGVITVHRGNASGPVVTTIDGDDATFDVLRSNRQLSVDHPSTVAVGDTLSVTVTDRATGEPVAAAEVVITGPGGDTTTLRTAANGRVLHDVGAPGTHELTVRRAGYEPSESTFEATDDGGDGGVTVTLRPSEPSVRPGGTTTLDVVVNGTGSGAGVGGYDLAVNSSDTARARIAGVADQTGGTARQSVASDGSGARLGAFGGDTADSGSVTIATVTVEGVAVGDVDIPLSVESMSDEAGRQYTVGSVTGAALSVSETAGPPPIVGDAAPTDPDGDGTYEDLNGDGDVTPGDSTVLFNAVFARNAAVTDNPAAFDFNGDNDVTAGDATVLFNEAFAG